MFLSIVFEKKTILYPSFDMWDLDTVDYGVNSHIYRELEQKDWDFLIAHYLGVDHCGHRYGPNHPEMERKLTELNGVIEDIVDKLDDNTILFVIGDHGMTETGNHGGDAEDEITSAFFMYSKQLLSSVQNHSTVVRQISIVPTMAAIFGVSVPFSNLGTIILDALPVMNNSYIQEWQFSLFYLWGNVQQMMNYIEDYAQTSPGTFSDSELKGLRAKYAILNSKLFAVDHTNLDDFAESAVNFLTNLRETCEKVWIQFDSFSMTRGLLFLFLSLFFVYMITDGIPSNRIPEIFMSSFLTCSYSVLFLATCVSIILYHFNFVDHLISTIFFSTGLVSQIMLVMLVIQNWELISLNWYDRSRREKILNLVCRLVLIFHLGGLFSNSFVVEESSVLLFLLATVILIGSLNVCQSEAKKKNIRIRWKLLMIAFGMLILVRISMYFWRCRDRLEQPWCYETYNTFTAKTETTKLQWIITVITLALFVTITKGWLRNCGNLNGYKFTVILLKYAPTVLVVCTSGYWVLSRLPIDGRNKSFRPWQANLLAWIVYGVSSVGILTMIIKPLCVYILPSNDASNDAESNAIPHLFHKVKRLFNEPNKEDIPVLCGLGTAYSAVFVAIGIYLTHLFALLHGDAAASSTVIMFLASAFVLIITSIIRLEKATTVEQLFDIPNMSLLVWVILAQYFFYGTGHQPSFPNIIWDAAFVGTTGVFKHNFIPGSLIIINTFCSQILMGFLMPLHLIVPFTISVMLPSITSKNVLEKENLRGEVLLYERNGLMLTVAFTTSCKYMICHAIRVFATMLAATIHCRHMMIWKIFAPKLIFESVGMFVTLATVNISYLVLLRVNSKIDEFVTSLNKRYK
ncbi:GPI ethanolamine phosphate transferase 3-like [Zophobas morio]|uniref:GPI ethanolamine phosphate transferase 3-like n=1 Tax=Zophobas morio TaxID=2755281 RepID=UPI0030834091